MNAPGLFPFVGTSRESLKRRLEHVLAGVRITPKVGSRWIIAASLLSLAAIAGVGFAQQGKRAPVPSAEPVSNPEIAKEMQPPGAVTASTASAPPLAVPRVPKGDAPKPAAPTPGRQVRGRVLLPNGQPAVGATVRAMTVAGGPLSWPESKAKLLGTFSTNADGLFEGKISAPLGTRPEWATRSGSRTRGRSIPGVDVNLWATLPAYGVALVQLDSVEGNDQIVVNLAEEDPIRGHLTDLEGRPIRDCHVEILRYTDLEAAAIDRWLAAVQGVKPEYRNTVASANSSSEWMPDGIVVPVRGDADGRFEFKGLGRDRLVALRISAPHATTILASVLTRPIKPIQFKRFEISGSQFERIVPPSVPVEGFVTDIETGKPIPGARIFPTAVWRDLVVQDFGAYVSAITDPRGHYRLEGLETVTTNEVSVRVPDLPYPQAYEILVPPAKSAEPIRQDIKLRHGVWAVGRAYDRTTNKPVSGIISYTPFRSNKFAENFDHQSNFARNDIVGTADASGHFRVLVIPGHGVVCLQCRTGDYRFDFGKAAIKDLASDSKSKRGQRPTYLPLSSAMYHSMREIDVAADAQEIRVDLAVDPGVNVLLKFADAMGNPLAGVDTFGLHFPDPRLLPNRGQSFVEGDSAILYATYPEESRHVWLRHRASGLTKLLQFTPKPGETKRTIIFEPPAAVTGRMVSPDGAAISGVPVSAYGVVPGGGWPPNLMSDPKGQFRIDFPAGGPFSLHTQWTQLVRELTVEAGEYVDLGDIIIEHTNNRAMDPKVHRGSEKRTKPAGAAKASSVSPPPSTAHPTPKGSTSKLDTPAHGTFKAAAPTTIREVSGRVLLPNGQPAVGATVRAIKAVGQPDPAATDQFTVLATLSADAKGEFRGSVDVGPTQDRRNKVDLWATLPGYGLALHPLTPAQKSAPIDMHLVEDEPIRGHIINLEGRPVREARIEVITFYDSTAAWVDQFIASAKDKPVYIHWLLPNRSLDENRGGREEAVFRVKSVASVSEALIPPQKTNSDGRFEIQGIGRDRHVYLKISGPRMATFVASVVTRPIKPIPFEFQETFGSQFERVASPTVPVDGSVTDEETGQPIAGVRIRPYAVKRGHTILQGGNMFVSATSDSQGHFRLEGLDTGLINLCRIEIPDLPYLSASEATIPASVSLEPIRLDIKLRRAIWAVGRAYDRSTGKPVSGVVSYTPFRSNELAAKYFSAQNPFLTSVNTGVVDADGRFRLPVIPGRGVVCLRCTNGLYRFDLGRTTIKELATAKRSQSPTLALLPANSYHSLHEINVAQDAREVKVDLPVEPGQNVVLEFTDAAGKPLSGVDAVGLVLEPQMLPPRSFTESDSATLYGTFPGDVRSVRLRHRASGLTKLFQFTPQPGETERTIVLEPPAVVTGRLVSDDGTPLSNIKLEFYTLVSSTLVALPPVITDAKGHFRQELPAGEPFNLKAGAFQPGLLVDRLTVAAGEQIDLGTITIERGPRERGFPKVHRDPVKRTKPLATAKASTASASAATSASAAKNGDGPWLFRGTVLRPDGQPAAGAQILALRSFWSSRVSWRPMEAALAGAKGEFEIRVPRPGYDGLGSGLLGLAARAEGFGIEWARVPSFVYGKKPSSPVVLRLVPESPIHGCVVDLEGRPVSGVHVRVVAQAVPREGQDLGPWLDVVKKGVVNASLGSQLPGYEDGTTPPMVSDRDGRFVVRGIGPERMVRLQVSGETIASAQFEVVTRQMTPIASVARTAGAYGPTQVFGKDFTYQAAPTKPIVGTVRDAVTGKPLAGVHLELSRHKFIGTQTDADGKFRLVGMPKETAPVPDDQAWNRNRLVAAPNLDQPYFGNEVDIPQTAGLDPVTLDIKLKRGLWITGRVTDKVTGKPVSAIVHYFPYGSNPFLTIDEWRTVERNKDESHRVTRPDGTYRIVGLPWRAIVGVRAGGGDYLKGAGASVIPGMGESGRFPTTLGPADAGFEHALKEINPSPGTESVACDLTLDPGGRVRLTLVDGAGKPVEDTFLLYLTPGIAVAAARPDSTFEIAGLAPKESRTYQITQWQRKIAKLFTFDYDDKASQTLTITLEPCATVRGRLLDEEGSPLKNVQVFASAIRNGRATFDLYPFGPVTDADGHFAIENLAAGCDSYKIQAFAPQRGFVTVAEKVSFAPGKTIDLGEIKIKRDGSNAISSSERQNPTPAPKTQTANATKPQAAPAAAAPSKGTVSNDETPRTIRGTVLRPDGKPATDATVSLYAFHWSSGDRIRWEPIASRGTNAHGEFELVAPPSDASGSDGKFFFATANGLGCDYQLRFSLDPSEPLVMKLVPDRPIRGRILDLEGKPVAGARVHVVTVTDSANRGLGPWLDAMKSGVERYSPAAHALLGKFVKTLPGGAGSTTTDQDGRFVLQGLGAERVVDLAIESDTTAYRQVTVVTRSLEPILRSASAQNGGLEIFGTDFTASARPTRLVVGTVRDAKTGNPLPGVGIESRRLAGEFFAGQRGLKTTSDAQGKYRLVGMPKGNGNAIFVVPHDDQPYFMREIAVPDADGMNPVTVDIELHRGLWITGRVTDKETGKPVPSRVNYWPFLTNTHTGGLPEFGPGRNMQGDYARYPTHQDGTFRVPGLPGRGLVGAEAMTGRYRQGAGASEIHDVDREGRLRTYRNQGWPSLKYPTTMKEINPAEGTESVVCDLVCDHGETVRITVLDPEGKPVSNCSTSVATKNGKATGIDSPFEVNNLPLNVVQPLLIEQNDRKLAKFMTFTLKEQSPRELTVQLEPCANVVGRLVDEDGTPLKGVSVDPRLRRSQDYWPRFPPVVCNSDGRFEYPNLPAGAAVDFFAQGAEIEFLQTFGRLSAPPGKKVDLGDIKLKRRR